MRSRSGRIKDAAKALRASWGKPNHRFSFLLSDYEYEALKDEAASRGISMAEVLRCQVEYCTRAVRPVAPFTEKQKRELDALAKSAAAGGK